MPPKTPLVSISIVSHGQRDLIKNLLDDLDRLYADDFELLLTLNIPEDESPYLHRPYPTKIIRNPRPKGFGANHNEAFKHCGGTYFAVVNPDIRLLALDWSDLLGPFAQPTVGVVAPKVTSPEGVIEDGVRRFPTFIRFIKRVVLRQRTSDYIWGDVPFEIDWAAGMFLLFRPDAFIKIKGFDDRRFFMYLEDADICRRVWKFGFTVIANPKVDVIHAAQRASRKSLKHLRWHSISAVRYLTGL